MSNKKAFGECHGHLFLDGVSFHAALSQHRDGVCDADLRRKLSEYQEAGVTFFRDGGDKLGVSLRARALAGEYGIDYRSPAFAIHKNGHYGGIVGRGFDTLKEYRDLVKEAERLKADFIKIMISGLVDFTGQRQLSEESLGKETIREMIHIAREEGFAVMAHANGDDAILAAAEAGVSSVEHGNFLSEEALQAMKEHDVVWVPTIVTISNLRAGTRYPAAVINALTERQSERVRQAYRIGVSLALGSDAGAYRVPHVLGLEDEYVMFHRILGEDPAIDMRLRAGEEKIRGRFLRIDRE